MEKKTLDQLIENHLGDLKSDVRVQKFIQSLEDQYSQYAIDKILHEKAQKINVYKQSYALLLELINTLKTESEQNTGHTLNQNLQLHIDQLKNESSAIVASIKNNKIHIEKLEKNNKELDQFAYVVAHDLKAPLRGISNLAEWIEEDIKGKVNPETDQNLKMLRSRVSKLENLIQGILIYAKAGKTKSNPEYIDTKPFIEEIIALLHPPKNSIIKFEGTWPTIKTDPIRFHQIVSNLISNSIKYNDKDQIVISLSCVVNGETFSFSITDNGNGIEEEYHEKIFQLFQTLANNDENSSTGIGLSIVKNIIDELGGKIKVESKLNVGSKFTFELPQKESANFDNIKI
jgi:signal transduction histidine kinase